MALIRLAAQVFLNGLALLLVDQLLPGLALGSFTDALLAALVIGLLNTLIRPVLLLLTLPITLITVGLFYFVVNAMLLWFAAYLLPGFNIDGFVTALLGSLLYSVLTTLIGRALR